MEPTASSGVTEWAVIGVWITVSVGIFGHLYNRMAEIREKMEDLITAKFDAINRSLEDNRREAQLERRAFEEARVRLVEGLNGLVTRAELNSQIDRLIETLERRSTPRGGP